MKYKIINILGKDLKCIEENGEIYYPYNKLSILFGKEKLVHDSTLEKKYTEYILKVGKINRRYINEQGIKIILNSGFEFNAEYKSQIDELYKYFKINNKKEYGKLLNFEIESIKDENGNIFYSYCDINKKIFKSRKYLNIDAYRDSNHIIKNIGFGKGNMEIIYIDEYLLKILILNKYNSRSFKNTYASQQLELYRFLDHYNLLRHSNIIDDKFLKMRNDFVIQYYDIIPKYVRQLLRKYDFMEYDNFYEDLVQESYLLLIKKFEKIDIERIENMERYIYGIVRHCIVDYSYKNRSPLSYIGSPDIRTKLKNAKELMNKYKVEKNKNLSLKEACLILNYKKSDINYIIDMENTLKNSKSFDDILNENDEDGGFNLQGKIGYEQSEYLKIEDSMLIDYLFSFLDLKSIQLVKEYYYNNKSFKEIAIKYNLPIHNVSKIINESLEIMRNNI